MLTQKQDSDTSFGSGYKALMAGTTQHRDAPNVVLFDRTDQRTYLAQTGLLPQTLPGHHTLFTARPGLRTLDANGQAQLVLEAEQTV